MLISVLVDQRAENFEISSKVNFPVIGSDVKSLVGLKYYWDIEQPCVLY